MSIELALFYTFSSLAIISALMVISLANAVYSVLFLIIVFCNVASLLLLSGVEFLAFILLIVYVGAIAVLFLFVVMMLNIKTSSFRSSI
jgi:NADH-quinone oxidoreductase subunit J